MRCSIISLKIVIGGYIMLTKRYSREDLQGLLKKFKNLQLLIVKRQDLEKSGDAPPHHSNNKTDYLFRDIDGNDIGYYSVILNERDTTGEYLTLLDEKINNTTERKAILSKLFILALSNDRFEIATDILKHGLKLYDCSGFRNKLHSEAARKFYDERAKEELNDFNIRPGAFFTLYKNGIMQLADLAAEVNMLEDVSKRVNYRSFEELPSHNRLLHLAVANGHVNEVKYLLDHDYRINTPDKFYNSALHYAACNNMIDMANILINRGINIDAINSHGVTALYEAAKSGHQEMVNLLLNAGAKVSCVNNRGISIWQDKAKGIVLPNDEENTQTPECDIYGHIRQHNETATLAINQAIINDKLRYYLSLSYRDLSYFSDGGNCNGLTFLYHFYDAKNQRNVFFKILETLAKWDGERSSLALPPPADIANFKTTGDLFEFIISSISLFQATGSTRKLANRMTQYDRNQQLALASDDISVKVVYNSPLIKIEREALLETLRVISRMKPPLHIELSGTVHVVALKLTGEGLFEYYDANLPYPVKASLTPEMLTDLLINYKFILCNDYGRLFATENQDGAIKYRANYPVKFICYRFNFEKIAENVPDYPTLDMIPSKSSEVPKLYTNTPHFPSLLAIAAATESKDSMEAILKCNLLSKEQSEEEALAMLALSQIESQVDPLEILVCNGNAEMVKLYLDHIKIVDIDRIRNGAADENNITNEAFRDKPAIYDILLRHPNYHRFSNFVRFALERICAGKDPDGKFDRAMKNLLGFNKIDPKYIGVVCASLPRQINLKDMLVLLARMSHEVLREYISRLKSVADDDCEIFFHYASQFPENNFQLLRTVLDRFQLDSKLYNIKRNPYTLLQKCCSPGNVERHALIPILLNHMTTKMINYQNSKNKETALHVYLYYVCSLDNSSITKQTCDLVKLFIDKGSNIDIPNARGQTCRDLISLINNKELNALIESRANKHKI